VKPTRPQIMAHGHHIGQLFSHFINVAKIKDANQQIKCLPKRLILRLIAAYQNPALPWSTAFVSLFNTLTINVLDHPL
jgi:hypothetical protein